MNPITWWLHPPTSSWAVTYLSVIAVNQSARELNRKLSAAQHLPLSSEERNQPLSAVGSRDKNAPLHLTLCTPAGHTSSGISFIAADSKVVHGEVAEEVGAGQVVKHESQSLGVRLVAQQHPVQVADPPGLTQLVPLPAEIATVSNIQLYLFLLRKKNNSLTSALNMHFQCIQGVQNY